jgi:CelD/BcsL family acetyltransferase involved in cellulose biosynthesis
MCYATSPNDMRASVPSLASVPDAFKAQAERWTDLAEAACSPNPFYHPALLIPALGMLDTGRNTRIIEAYEGNLLIGLLPIEKHKRHGRYPLPNVSNLQHIHCFYGAPLIRKGHEQAAWTEILRQLDAVGWAGQFLHLLGQDPNGPAMQALESHCRATKRPFEIIHRYERAKLQSEMTGEEYWNSNVRSKKRKELRRLVNRLEECGTVTHGHLENADDLGKWCDDFLKLEASGWKGANGTALINNEAHRSFFIAACANALTLNMLDMLRIDVDGKPIAMLVNFRHLQGSFSFKIAIDEEFGRYSPGVLIEIDNLYAVQASDSVQWMDSCAKPDHPMIDSLWVERRTIAQYRVALKGKGLRRPLRAISFQALHVSQAGLERIKGRKNR